MSIDGGDLVARALRREGVKHLFALSGDYIQAIFDACLDEDIRIIDTRHEQAAVHMADGWARVTGEPGVALVTAGPGVADAVPGMSVAYHAASPVVLLAGRIPMRDFGSGWGMDFDQVALMRPVTKWGASCYHAPRIPEYVGMALGEATSGRPGPVFLDIPSDVLEAKVEEEDVFFLPRRGSRERAQGDPALVEAAIDLLAEAERPLVIAGSGVWWSGAGEELKEFIETAGIPLILSQMGRGAVAEDHPLCFGPLRVGTREADVILAVGARINYWLTRGRPPLFGTDQKWIQVDIEGAEIGRHRAVDIGIVGDARQVLRQLVAVARGRLRGRSELPWVAECRRQARARQERNEADSSSDNVPIHPLRLCREINAFLDRDAAIALDGGDISVFATMALRVHSPGSWLELGNSGHLGAGIPFAMAAKLARPERQALVLSGDGSFGFNGMELDTAVRHNLPIVVVVANDGAWGMIKHRQELIYGRDRVVGTELGVTRFDLLARALGGYGEVVERPEEIRSALERAFAAGVPAVLDVRTDPTAVSPLTRRSSVGRG